MPCRCLYGGLQRRNGELSRLRGKEQSSIHFPCRSHVWKSLFYDSSTSHLFTHTDSPLVTGRVVPTAYEITRGVNNAFRLLAASEFIASPSNVFHARRLPTEDRVHNSNIEISSGLTSKFCFCHSIDQALSSATLPSFPTLNKKPWSAT